MTKQAGKCILASLIGMIIGCGSLPEEQMSAITSKVEAIPAAARAQIQASCKGTHPNHGSCVSCVDQATDALLAAGTITGRQKGQIVSSFAQNECRAKCIPTSCNINAECGVISDLCGQELDCGTCPGGFTCDVGSCIPEPTGPNRVVCFCLDGTMQTACAAIDCSSSVARAEVCAPLCASHLRLDGAGCGTNDCATP